MLNQDNKPTKIQTRFKVKPSLLAMIALLPLFLFPFFTNPNYREALKFIFPGLGLTLALTLLSYLLAFLLAILLIKMRLQGYQKKAILKFLIASLILFIIAFSLLLLPKQNYVLIGEETGTIVIVKGIPSEISNLVREGSYSESAKRRMFRIVPRTEIAIERLSDPAYNYTAALILKNQAPTDSKIIWEKTISKTFVKNSFRFLLALSFIIFALSLVAWYSKIHPLSLFSELYIDLARGIPIIIVVVVGYILLPKLFNNMASFRLPPLVLGIITLALAHAAYIAEILRVNLQESNQVEKTTKKILGISIYPLNHLLKSRRTLMPLLSNEFNAILRNTVILTVVSSIGLHRYSREFASSKLQAFPAYYVEAVLFILIAVIGSSLFKYFETRNPTEQKQAPQT